MENPNKLAGFSHLARPTRLLSSFLRFFFKLLYHQFACTYDLVACLVSLGAWQAWVQSVLPDLAGPRTLEIGFGPGHLLYNLQKKGVTAFGLDESPQMIRIARGRLSDLSSLPGLVRGTAESLPFASESMHQVAMTFPAEFVLKPASLIEIKRVLVKGGMAIVLPMAWITGRKPWERAAAWINLITGQAPAWDERVLIPLKNLGFEVTWTMVNLPSSRLLIVQLQKSAL